MSRTEPHPLLRDTTARHERSAAPSDSSLHRIARLAAHGLDLPAALVFLVEGRSLRLAAAYGTSLARLPRGSAILDAACREAGGLVLPDACADPCFADDPLVTGPPHVRFFAAACLTLPDSQPIGAVCVFSPLPSPAFAKRARLFLADLAETASGELEHRRTTFRQTRIAADLAYWNRLSEEIAAAAGFDEAVDRALARCAERTGASLCFLAGYHPTYRLIEYVTAHVSPESGLRGFDMTRWPGGHAVDDVSFGAGLAEDRIVDSGPLRDLADLQDYVHLTALFRAGVRRQLAYPFDLADRRFGLVLDFETPAIPENTGRLVQDFLARLAPLLMGRLREDALERANRTLRTIHATTEAFAGLATAEALHAALCRLAVETGGYDTCWIGLAGNEPGRPIRIAACAGKGVAYVEQLRLSWGDTPEGQGPAGTAIREGRISRWRDIAVDPRFEPWRAQAHEAGFRACMALPIGLPATPAPAVFTLYSSNPMAFGEEEQALLVELTANLTKALRDVATRQERDAALTARSMSERRIEWLLAASGTVLYTLSLQETAALPLEISRNIIDLLGYAPEEVSGPDWWPRHVHPDDLPRAGQGVALAIAAGHHVHRYRIRHRDGGFRWIRDELTLQRDADGTPSAIAGVWIDITEHHEAEEQIYRLAHLDPLTELPNRRLLNERLGAALDAARRDGSHGALLFIDLDRFKTINDMLGHSAGDAALGETARRLRVAVGAADTIARIGGDEFVVVLAPSEASAEAASAHATALGHALIETVTSRPISIGGRHYYLGASIGFTLFPKPADTIDTLIREADTAMYRAKSGDGDVVMFRPQMYQSILDRHAVEDDIRSALKDERFEIWLQEQVDAAGAPAGVEALLRLRGRDGRLTPPDRFVGVAESSGLIVPLGRWLLGETCRLMARIGADRADWRMSVNVSPRQFRDPAFVADVLAALDQAGVAPARLTLEITENLLIRDPEEVARIMDTLAARGVRFSVDDFGTGYSSLLYLRRLPIHELKIDRGFISQVPDDASAVAIVEAILAMARQLDLDIVAEGVETAAHVDFLRARGPMRMQGYFFAAPRPAAAWLAAAAAAPPAAPI